MHIFRVSTYPIGPCRPKSIATATAKSFPNIFSSTVIVSRGKKVGNDCGAHKKGRECGILCHSCVSTQRRIKVDRRRCRPAFAAAAATVAAAATAAARGTAGASAAAAVAEGTGFDFSAL